MFPRFLIIAVVSSCVWAGPSAWAEPCEGEDCAEDVPADNVVKPTRELSLIGSSCSYSTASMLKLAFHHGETWTYMGPLERVHDRLSNRVAAPWVAGERGPRLIANQLMADPYVDQSTASSSFELIGRIYAEHGQRYVVVTSARILHGSSDIVGLSGGPTP